MTSPEQKSGLNLLTVSLIVLVVLLAGACTYFVLSAINQKSNQTTPTQTTTIQQIIPETRMITCPEVNKNLEIVDAAASFNTAHLAPIETNISTNILFNDAGILAFKHFNMGGQLFSVEKEPKRFGGSGPYFVTEILDPTEQNTSLVATEYLPEEVGEQLMGSGAQSTAVGLKRSWFFLSITGCEMGCSDTDYRADQKLIRVTYHDKNTVQEFRLPTDFPLLDQLIGYKDSMVLFSERDNKKQFAGFDSGTNTWKKLTETDLTNAVINKQPISDAVKNLIAQNRCFSYKTPGAGTILFTHHTVETTFFNGPPDDNLLDIYFDGKEKQLETWKR